MSLQVFTLSYEQNEEYSRVGGYPYFILQNDLCQFAAGAGSFGSLPRQPRNVIYCCAQE